MKKLSLIAIAMLAGTVLAGLISAPVWAQSPRTFVSSQGSDAGSCTLQLPCLTLNRALSLTSPGGEVIVLTSGSYAPAIITQSVTIEAAPGVYAGITPVGPTAGLNSAGVNVNGGTVVLRGLTIQGGGGGDGIDFNSRASALSVENCAIDGVDDGIYSGSIGELYVKDTVIRNDTADGILIAGGGSASLDRVTLDENAGQGLEVTSGRASVTNSVASGNHNGMEADAGSTFTAEINVESCTAVNSSGDGIVSTGNGTNTVRVSNSTVTDNSVVGLVAEGADVLQSRVNNTVEGNGTPTVGVTSFSPL